MFWGFLPPAKNAGERAAELFGASQGMRAGMGATPSHLIAMDVDEAEHKAEQVLGSFVFTQSLATGRAMDLEEVVKQCVSQV